MGFMQATLSEASARTGPVSSWAPRVCGAARGVWNAVPRPTQATAGGHRRSRRCYVDFYSNRLRLPGRPGGRVAGAAGSGVVDQHPAHDLPVLEILVALVERVQCVRGGDQLVELELALVVQAQQLDDVVLRVGGAEQRSLDGLAEQGH